MTQTVLGSNAAGAPDVGPLPPYDVECEAGLVAMGEPAVDLLALTSAQAIPMLRGLGPSPVAITPEVLSLGGAYASVEWRVPGPAGAPEIALLICTPVNLTSSAPAIYHVHGGGMIMGDRRTSIVEILDLAEPFGAVVVSVEYRLAPEHPDPAPVEDCYAGLVWTAAHASELGIDVERLVIAGASSGGGLAAGTALLARDRGGPPLAGQLLMCPMLDDRNSSVSSVQAYDKGTWTGITNELGWRALLGDRQGGPDVSIYAAPARAKDLSGLPPTLLDVGSAEVFRSETVAFAEQIWSCGGVAELHVWPGGYHGYERFAPQALVSQATIEARQSWLRRLFSAA